MSSMDTFRHLREDHARVLSELAVLADLAKSAPDARVRAEALLRVKDSAVRSSFKAITSRSMPRSSRPTRGR